AVRVSRQGRIETSNDGNTWAEQPLGIRTFVRGVASLAFGNGRFVARGEVGTILTSTNANEWAARRLEDSLYVGRIIFQDNVFLVRSSDCVFSTTTGSMWAWQQVETAKIP